ncbi:MAG: hypothetical protein EBU31_00325 [Proteobacteria bacterium]|nr:hypothetical protein [Pseudomonadota bacterium]
MDSWKCGSADGIGTCVPHGQPISGTSRCGMALAGAGRPGDAGAGRPVGAEACFAGAAGAWGAACAEAPGASNPAAATIADARNASNALEIAHGTLLRFGLIDGSSDIAPGSAHAPGMATGC